MLSWEDGVLCRALFESWAVGGQWLLQRLPKVMLTLEDGVLCRALFESWAVGGQWMLQTVLAPVKEHVIHGTQTHTHT